MNSAELYRKLAFPEEVSEALLRYEKDREIQVSEALKEKLLTRSSWEEGLSELKELLGNDEDGFKIL